VCHFLNCPFLTGYERDGETELDFAQARYYANVQGRFTSVDPAFQQVRSIVNPQNWNGYAYAINNPFTYVDRNGRWPTPIHDLIIRLSFPGLGQGTIETIQSGSFNVDFPRTFLESHANEHAMLRPGQTLEEAQRGYQAFIDDRSAHAKQDFEFSQSHNTVGYLDASVKAMVHSLFTFGESIHPIMDNTSPAHNPFQMYYGLHLAGGSYIDRLLILSWAYDVMAHTNAESSISDAQLNGAISVVREHYLRVYGKAMYSRAVPPFFQSATFIMVNGSPMVNAGNLGTITVRPDGSQDYDGPLIPKKKH
jgi:RHS repeat-associated protein